MKITDYRVNEFISSCPNAYLATGTPHDDDFNRELLKKKETGWWATAAGRVNVDDAIFLILPNKAKGSHGYPRQLYVGVVKKMVDRKDDRNRNRVLFSVNKFLQLSDVNSDIRVFLNGYFPPTGSSLIPVWQSKLKNDRVASKKVPLLGELLKAENRFENIKAGEKEALVKVRLNQDKLREASLFAFDKKCCLSGMAVEEILVCSHIKPWVKSLKHEKCDKDNTLLLAATWDRLFDRGFISFTSAGKIIISNRLTKNDCLQLGIKADLALDKKYLTRGRIDYLKYHRKYIFKTINRRKQISK
jgi:hypothetical protein